MRYLSSYKLYDGVLSKEYQTLATIVNMNLINDIKDMSLEYIDAGYALNIKVYNRTDKSLYSPYKYTIIADIYYDHNTDKLFLSHFDYKEKIEWSLENIDTITYSAYIISFEDDICDGTSELNDRIKEAYPNEVIGDYNTY